MVKVSEFRAYPWIDGQLSKAGWDTRNPNATPEGQVWTQNEALAHPEIKKALGTQKPESVIRIDANTVAVVEAKRGSEKIDVALAEAKDYCTQINAASDSMFVPLAIGVAGDESSGFYVNTEIFLEGTWHRVEEGDDHCGRFLSQDEYRRLLNRGSHQLVSAHLTISQAVSLAGEINSILHTAKVEKEKRAITVALLILALHQDPALSFSSTADIFINDINSRASQPFLTLGRSNLWNEIKITYSQENLKERADGISRVLDLLKSADIASAAKHHDILGNFFESFLKYGNTSKELGIVLTPRHICRLASEAVAVSQSDVVLDVAAGTGGFLVSAYNRVKSRSTLDAARDFAARNLYGCEDSGPIAALAFINMYLRGDGKHNLKNDSCFNWDLLPDGAKASFEKRKIGKPDARIATKVLMNPPFALKNDIQEETDFLDHALRQLVDNGVLFAILPSSIMYERSTADWRENLLKHHTLLSVVALPPDLFYPVSTETVGIFLRAWSKHPASEPVLWARVSDDGFVKRKRFRVERGPSTSQAALKNLTAALQTWIMSGVQTNASVGAIEFRPLKGDEALPHAHLGTPPLSAADFDEEAMGVVRNILIEQWGRPRK